MSANRAKNPQSVLAFTVAGALALSLGACGTTTQATSETTETSTWGDTSVRDESSLTGTVFDANTIHTFAVTYDETAYKEMLAAYKDSGVKEWLEASVTIDGKTFEKVGLRLKGNSSLRSISDDTLGQDIPWLIRLDKFVTNQQLDGYTDFVIRSNASETALNEAVAQQLFAEAGLASQAPIAVRFSVNGSDETLRLAVENPNDEWDSEQFDSDGILYKAEADGDYSYRGDDAASYVDVFDQETDSKNENFEPLTSFLRFINESDDQTFASKLSEHLDVDAFAGYLAMQDLVDNFDDIDGPGNNSYLRWSESTNSFTVVSWDLNLAFGSSPGGMGGMGQGTGDNTQGFPSGQGGDVQGFDPNNLPEGFDPQNMPQRPQGDAQAQPDTATQPSTEAQPNTEAQDGDGTQPDSSESQTNGAPQGRGQGGPGGMNKSNVLKERFLEVTEFKEAYEQAATDLKATLFGSGRAQEILDSWTTLLIEQASDLVATDVVSSDATKISTYFSKN